MIPLCDRWVCGLPVRSSFSATLHVSIKVLKWIFNRLCLCCRDVVLDGAPHPHPCIAHSLRPAVGATFGTVHCALENGLRTGAGVVRLCVLILRGIDGSEFEISGVEGVYERGNGIVLMR